MSNRWFYPVVAAIALIALSAVHARAASGPVAISVHPEQKLAKIHNSVLGVNSDTRYDGVSVLAALSKVYSEIGVSGARWPGGVHSDLFNWQDSAPRYCDKAGQQPVNHDGNFDDFMNTLALPGSLSPEITVNYGTSGIPSCLSAGDPALAAAWVNYANNVKHYGIKWWEVGNEVYEPAEPDNHPNPHTPESYAQYEPSFYSAMKAADSSIHVGIPITAGSHNRPGWDEYLLANAHYDYVAYHYYPQFYPNISDSGILAAPITGSFAVSKIVANIRSKLERAGKCNAPCADFPISISEWNSVSHNPTPQTFTIVQGLFAAETLGEFFNAGVTRAEFWVDHGCQMNNPGRSGYNTNPPADVYGWQRGAGTQGLSTVLGIPDRLLCPGSKFSVPAETIFPSGRALQIYAKSAFSAEGSSALAADQPSPTIRTYASYNENAKHYVIVLLNLDGSSPAQVDLAIDGVPGGPRHRIMQYSKQIYDETRNDGPWRGPLERKLGPWRMPMRVDLPPWSMTSFTLELTDSN